MKPITFKSAILTAHNTPLDLFELEIPHTLYVGQVLVKIAYSGVCGAQLNEIKGVKGLDKYLPHCLRHEGSGIVTAVGPGVKHVHIGDHAVMHWRKGAGIESEPPKYRNPQTGKDIGGGWVTTFQEYAVVSENRLTKVHDDVPMDVAALLGCAVTTGLGLIMNELRMKAGQSLLVFGCGGVGLNVIQGARLCNVFPIIGVDIAENKLRQAASLGADYVCTPGELSNFCRKNTLDATVDTTGKSEIMQLAWEYAGPEGRACYVAQLPHDQTVGLQTNAMHGGKTVFGSNGGGTNPTEDIPRYVRLLQAGRLKLRPLITHTFRLDEINTALDNIRSGSVGRAIIEM